ncbi:MAG: hypothetical protein ACTSSJ_04005 [Candidatus Odinarchaeia archaeon]
MDKANLFKVLFLFSLIFFSSSLLLVAGFSEGPNANINSTVSDAEGNLYPPLILKRVLEFNWNFLEYPPVLDNGIIYVVTQGSEYDTSSSLYYSLYAVSINGTKLWSFTSVEDNLIIGGPPCVTNDFVYVGGYDGHYPRFIIYCLNKSTGEVVWFFDTPEGWYEKFGGTLASQMSSPVVADGKVFFGSSRGSSSYTGD